MAILNWEDVEEISVDEAKRLIIDRLQLAGFKATSWQRFSIPLTLVEIGALLWHEASKNAVFFKGLVFNSTSQGEGLTRLSASHYDNEREGATNATRLVTLSCASGEGPHTIDVGEVVISDDDGITFRNVEGNSITYPVVLASGGTQTLLFEAEEAGTGGNVPDDTVTTLVTTLAGVTITSDTLDTEGVDEEDDDRLRERNQTKWALLTGHEVIDDAVKAIVLNASASIASVKVHSDNPRGAGTFDIYISGTEQTSSQDDVDAAQEAINPYVFGDSTALVIAAEEVELDLIGNVYFVPSVGESAARQAVEDALEEYLLAIPLGGVDYSPGPSGVVPLNDIEATIKGAEASGERCVRTVTLSVPSSNFPVGNFRKVVRGDWSALTFTPTNA